MLSEHAKEGLLQGHKHAINKTLKNVATKDPIALAVETVQTVIEGLAVCAMGRIFDGDEEAAEKLVEAAEHLDENEQEAIEFLAELIRKDTSHAKN